MDAFRGRLLSARSPHLLDILYHAILKKSIVFSKYLFVILHKYNAGSGLLFVHIDEAGARADPKKIFQNIEKTLDKWLCLCYNIDRKGE